VDVPLVVIDTDYALSIEREAPFGDNVVFRSPSDELAFLTSLDQVGPNSSLVDVASRQP
jgi:hypothetical protein